VVGAPAAIPGKHRQNAADAVPGPGPGHGGPGTTTTPQGQAGGAEEARGAAFGIVAVNFQLGDAAPRQFGFDQPDRLGLHAGPPDGYPIHKIFCASMLHVIFNAFSIEFHGG
jgi:hypothetical protein